MSDVADGPETNVRGRRARTASPSCLNAAGTPSTTWLSSITHKCTSGTRLSARLPSPGPPVEHNGSRLGDAERAAGEDGTNSIEFANVYTGIRDHLDP
jgi:hypothetical protein